MSVLMPVTSTGRRGMVMGGQVSLAMRYTRKAPTSPAKNIVSAPRKISIPNRALFSGVLRWSSSSPWRSPSPSSSGGSGENGGGPCGRGRTCERGRTSTGSSTRPSSAVAIDGACAIRVPSRFPYRVSMRMRAAANRSTNIVITMTSTRRFCCRTSSRRIPCPFLQPCDLIQGHQQERAGQVDERGKQQTPCRRHRVGARQVNPKTKEDQPKDESHHTVYRPCEPNEGRQQAHCQQGQTVGDHMASGARTFRINDWQDAKASASIIVTVESSNGQRMGYLPQKQYGKQHPHFAAKGPACRHPAHYGW